MRDKVWTFFSAVLFLTVPSTSIACSMRAPQPSEVAYEVAAEGVLISGRVIQGFDLDKDQPEIIRADEIFIGEGGTKEFEIYRPSWFFANEKKMRDQERRTGLKTPCGPPQTFSLGKMFDRLVLVPAKDKNSPDANGKWQVVFGGNQVIWGKGLDLLLKESRRLGRYRGSPSKSHADEDCFECTPPFEDPSTNQISSSPPPSRDASKREVDNGPNYEFFCTFSQSSAPDQRLELVTRGGHKYRLNEVRVPISRLSSKVKTLLNETSAEFLPNSMVSIGDDWLTITSSPGGSLGARLRIQLDRSSSTDEPNQYFGATLVWSRSRTLEDGSRRWSVPKLSGSCKVNEVAQTARSEIEAIGTIFE